MKKFLKIKVLVVIIVALIGFKVLAQGTLDQQLFEFHTIRDANKIKTLLDLGANPNATDRYGNSILMYASGAVGIPDDVVKILISHGANVNYYNKVGTTPLINAVGMNNYGRIKLLIENGADTNGKGLGGKTPLMNISAYMGSNNELVLNIVKLLIEHGANVNTKNSQGQNAIMVSRTDDPEFFNYLIEKGADINAIDNFEKTQGRLFC